jgi:hypothetical protein
MLQFLRFRFRNTRTFHMCMLENNLQGESLCYLPYFGPGFLPFPPSLKRCITFEDPQPLSKSSFYCLVARCHSFRFFFVLNIGILYIRKHIHSIFTSVAVAKLHSIFPHCCPASKCVFCFLRIVAFLLLRVAFK